MPPAPLCSIKKLKAESIKETAGCETGCGRTIRGGLKEKHVTDHTKGSTEYIGLILNQT